MDDDDDKALGAQPVRIRASKQVSSSSLQTPHDPDVSYGKKGQGYETQISETTGNKSEDDPEKPEVITHVEVTRSCDNDIKATIPVIESLKEKGLQPEKLEVDTNYTSSEVVEKAGNMGTDLNGPVKGVAPEKEEGKNLGEFKINMKEAEKSECPEGKPVSEQKVDGKGRISLIMVAVVCATCVEGATWAAREKEGEELREVKTKDEYSTARRREYAKTEEFKKRQAKRAGIEATNSETKRAHGLGRMRVRGIERVKVAVYLKAAACNIKRATVYLGKKQAGRLGKKKKVASKQDAACAMPLTTHEASAHTPAS